MERYTPRMCLLLQPLLKIFYVRENPLKRAPPVRSLPLAFIILLFIAKIKMKYPLTNCQRNVIIISLFDIMEAYRSGHNGTDSKSVVPHGTVGSNPTASASYCVRKWLCRAVCGLLFFSVLWTCPLFVHYSVVCGVCCILL